MNTRERGVECRQCGYFGPPLVYQSREDESMMGLVGRGIVRFGGLFVPAGGIIADSLLDTDQKYLELECPNCHAHRPYLTLRRGEISDEAWAIYEQSADEIAREERGVALGCGVILALITCAAVAYIAWRLVTVP